MRVGHIPAGVENTAATDIAWRQPIDKIEAKVGCLLACNAADIINRIVRVFDCVGYLLSEVRFESTNGFRPLYLADGGVVWIRGNAAPESEEIISKSLMEKHSVCRVGEVANQ